jgi:hypothetical protein
MDDQGSVVDGPDTPFIEAAALDEGRKAVLQVQEGIRDLFGRVTVIDDPVAVAVAVVGVKIEKIRI